jgi:putative sterol carrier protein
MTSAKDPTTAFFDELASRGHEPLLEKATGTLRIDLTDGRRSARWLVAITKGDVAVSRQNRRADCVARADRTVFEGIVKGEVNAMAAALRGAISVEGDPQLLVQFQRLFPGPPKRSKRRR